ncbi:MAG TPA: dienelactone hydrolase family protein [Syntrophales bacterium]|nr:dienelactone hydrolase family protein [Syntrophales bacterium]HOX95732.1 dienelactone hydrolase family protein [Syntrophales bacterium]HPI56590.1 dienelactone hydrolase family protein [Syntrophales bacterium]HPN24989.1 dienelactone hydrolase family protein [Syntrophales bacterium]HQM29269.1 dienelactone hydrolase family protein [Syntrophales bacterium]
MKAFSINRVSIPVGARGATSGLLAIPGRYREGMAVVVAHGAGNDMESPLIASFAEGLADAGYLTLRFNFLYRDRGMRIPDDEKTLAETWQAAYRFIKEESGLSVHTFIAAGKSLGGRIASRMASAGLLPADRLIFLGYPLHPPEDRGKLRDAHLYTIKIPMLFFAGTRDPLCDLDLLKSVLDRIRAPWKLCTIEGGDHSFQRQGGPYDPSVHDRIVQETVLWLQERHGGMKGQNP